MMIRLPDKYRVAIYLGLALVVTFAAYWPGLSGDWIFDDFPNIVDNPAVQPAHASIATLIHAALSSPASDFRRPLASLSFAANYLLAGSLDPFQMKLTNVVIHLVNGLLVFLLSRMLLAIARPDSTTIRVGILSTLIAASWMLLPINLTAVLYVVQRMESMANAFVLLGLIGYIHGRCIMMRCVSRPGHSVAARPWLGYAVSACALVVGTSVGSLAKETAVMLPAYAFLIEWVLFGFRASPPIVSPTAKANLSNYDWRIFLTFVLCLALPLIAGMAWYLPRILTPNAWGTRGFDLSTRLLTESRVVVDYIIWTVLPTPGALSFYHDDFPISKAWLSPWTTSASAACLLALACIAFWQRRHRPLVTLGLGLFLCCHLLTATVLPLELAYEHRNYFSSFALLLALIPLLEPFAASRGDEHHSFSLARTILMSGLIILWGTQTFLTSTAWGNKLGLAIELASRAPNSPRAQYELGRTYIIYSGYRSNSPFVELARKALENAATLPGSSILPEQALIFMYARMHMTVEDDWWNSMIGKLKRSQPGVQDESSLASLSQCKREGNCEFPPDRLGQAYLAALSHPNPSARLQSSYGDYAWNVLDDKALGLKMEQQAVLSNPHEAAYRITLIRMLMVLDLREQIPEQMTALKAMNIGGQLDSDIRSLSQLSAGSQPSANR
jgi:hypothetical protein